MKADRNPYPFHNAASRAVTTAPRASYYNAKPQPLKTWRDLAILAAGVALMLATVAAVAGGVA